MFRACVSAETFARMLNASISTTQALGSKLGNATTTNPFTAVVEEGDTLSPQFQQVAKLIKLRGSLGTERDFFFTELGEWRGGLC